jgi:hypothetical protein
LIFFEALPGGGVPAKLEAYQSDGAQVPQVACKTFGLEGRLRQAFQALGYQERKMTGKSFEADLRKKRRFLKL